MSHPLAQLKQECLTQLNEATNKIFPGLDMSDPKFGQPPSSNMGEVSSAICYQLSRQLKQKPSDIADNIVAYIKPSTLLSRAESVNGYINFHANRENYYKLVFETAASNSSFGFMKVNNPIKIIVEHTSANPIHPITIGTARNSILGASLAELLRKRGHDVLVHFLVNDMGRQVALATYGWTLLGMPEPNIRGELFVGAIYASVNVITELNRIENELKIAESKGDVPLITELQEELEKFQGASEELLKTNPRIFNSLKEKLSTVTDSTSEIVKINTAYENHEPITVKKVRKLVKTCLDGFEESLGDMGIRYDSFDYESDLVWNKKAEEVLEALKRTPYVEVDDGALVLDCDAVARDYGLKKKWGLNEAHEIPRLVLVRRDGTTLYTLRDMAYSIYKFNIAKQVINVIGYEQTLAQLQLRIALVAMNKSEMGDNQIHYAYEFVKLPGMKMSGRLGRYVTLLEVTEKLLELAWEEVSLRTPDLTELKKREIARMVGYGAIKYSLLSVDPYKTVIFDWAKALNFETNSAPFIQYSHARCCNIIKRVESKPDPKYDELVDLKEREIVNLVAAFPDVFVGAADGLKPGDVTAYVNNLADKFNSFYSSLRVLNADTPGMIGARISLVEAVRVVLRNCMEVLGIEAPERM